MEFKQFDAAVKSALENVQPPYDPASWDALESRLSAMPPPDAIDQRLRPTLERLEPSFDESSWATLASKMDGLARARRVKWIKATEAALMLLLLLNVRSVFQAIEQVPVTPVKPTIQTNEPIAAKSGKQKSRQTEAAAADNSSSLAAQVLQLVQSVAQSLNSEPATSDNPEQQQSTAFASAVPTAAQSSSADRVSAAGTPFLLTPARTTAEPHLFASNLALPKVSKAASGPFYTGFSGQYDQNTLVQDGYKDQKSGYGGGLVVGYRKGKWGVETGIQYSSKTYQPKRDMVEYLNNPFQGIAFYYNNEVSAEVVSIPLKATRRVFKAGKTSGHLVAGLSGHFAASKNYQYQTVHYPPPQPVPNPNPVLPGPAPAPSGKGILENGGMTHNAYATADLGFRLEHSLGSRYSAFIEPIYRKSLGGGLGPVASRLNTTSVQAGILATL